MTNSEVIPAAGGSAGDRQSLDERLSDLLSSPSFTVPSYLNLALDRPENENEAEEEEEEDEDEYLQRRMAELALQLQLQTQSCHDEIGRIGAELQAILPRCAADVGRLSAGLEGMAMDAAGLLESVSSTRGGGGGGGSGVGDAVEGKAPPPPAAATGGGPTASGGPNGGTARHHPDALETLSTLHALRSNLTQTKSILAAASSWDATLSSVPSLLSSPATLSEAVSALSKLESGERALRGMPGRDGRSEAIGKVRGQIETLLRPQLLHALQRMDTRLGPLQQCVGMYRSLGKVESLKGEYVKQRPGAVHKGWFAYGGGGGASSASSAASSDADGEEEGGGIPAEISEGGSTHAISTTPPPLDPAMAFVEWLPGWYDDILALLSEERRRSTAVFGPDLAPEIIARVLAECFRPILPSFKSRLAAICSPGDGDDDAASTPARANGNGSLEAICSLYGSTLQFLSLCYEQLAGLESHPLPPSTPDKHSDPSSAPKTASSGAGMGGPPPSPLEIERLVRDTFASAASPFGPYQKRFARLELVHTKVSSKMVDRDIHAAVGGRNNSCSTLSGLQDAVERLSGLAPFMFPLVEASMARFELLNCGYNAPAALSTVDTLLSDHTSELTIAIGTLSATLTSDEDKLADNFDDQYVHCALEVLKIAGSLRRELRSFEEGTKTRLRGLCGRMAAAIAHEEEMRSAAKGGGAGASYVLPDSLSALEVEAILAKAVCGGDGTTKDGDDAAPASLRTLQRLASSDVLAAAGGGINAPASLFHNTSEATTKLARTCHSFVYDVCSAVPLRSLRKMPTLEVWRENGGDAGGDSYGTLPQQYITQVGEHMLALVQALEPFASSGDALSLANEVMDGASDVALQPWREFASATGSVDAGDEDVVSALMAGKNLPADLQTDNGFEQDDEAEEEEEEDEAAKASATFCNEWLDVVGSAVTGRLLERLMRIQHLSRSGCEHLSADLNYLVNVFSALGIAGHPHPLLGHFGHFVTLDGGEAKAKVASRDARDGVAGAIRAAEVRLALMRGIVVS